VNLSVSRRRNDLQTHFRHAQRSDAPCHSVMRHDQERVAQQLNLKRTSAQHRTLNARRGFVSRREALHWSFGLAHKGRMCCSETPRRESRAEQGRNRLVVDKGTGDSRATTARSPARRLRKFAREQCLPLFLDHQAGRIWTFVLYAGRARPSRSLARPPVWRRPASSPRGRASVSVDLSCGRIPSQMRPSTLKVASGGIGRRSSKPILGVSEAI
jgi:hypothetical protein